MIEQWHNHYLLLAFLALGSSAGFAQTPVEPREQSPSLFSKLQALFKSSGVATLSVFNLTYHA